MQTIDGSDSALLMDDLLRRERQKRRELLRDEMTGDFEQELLNELLCESSSEDEPGAGRPTVSRTRSGTGARKGKKPNVPRDHVGGHLRLMEDFFGPQPRFDEIEFRKQFRMSKSLLLKIVDQLAAKDIHFTQRKDALGVLGHSSLQKVLAAIRQLVYGIGFHDILEEYVRMADSTALECLIRFCKLIIELYGETYLRAPTEADVERLSNAHAKRGFPGMLGSLDFTYWEWARCPTSWSGRFQGKDRTPTTVLEVVASYDSWIWSAFFSTPGTCKDIDVFAPAPPIYSPQSITPGVKSTINGNEYQTGYYLSNVIYPMLPPLIPPVTVPRNTKEAFFAKRHAAALKDVKRAVAKLQSRFGIVKLPCRLWSSLAMGEVIKAVIILHNMIVEDERPVEPDFTDDPADHQPDDIRVDGLPQQVVAKITSRIQRFSNLSSSSARPAPTNV